MIKTKGKEKKYSGEERKENRKGERYVVKVRGRGEKSEQKEVGDKYEGKGK